MRVLGIESSCDETSVAVVRDGRHVESLVIASQTEIHARYHGVVPEVASRAHVEQIGPVLAAALQVESDEPVVAVAVTSRPGLSGSLAVGVAAARAFAWARSIPLVDVDHMLAHAYAVQLERSVAWPYVVLLVSGGHTLLAIARGPTELEVLGTTIDDACGEAFDKVSVSLGLGYPGGPRIEAIAKEGDADAYRFPQSPMGVGGRAYDVSYSGLKTAVIHQRDRFRRAAAPGPHDHADIAASFQRAALEPLIARVRAAVHYHAVPRVTIGGGVAANETLRALLRADAAAHGYELFAPRRELCLDNGAMVAGLGHALLTAGYRSPESLGVQARVARFRAPK